MIVFGYITHFVLRGSMEDSRGIDKHTHKGIVSPISYSQHPIYHLHFLRGSFCIVPSAGSEPNWTM